MANKQKKAKPYNSPGHVNDHPAFNLPAPSGGDHAGTEMGQPMPPAGPMGMPGQGAQPPGFEQ